MAVLTIRNVPDEVHRALRLRAQQAGRSTEAEVRAILKATVKRPGRIRLGSLLHEIGRQAGITNDDVDALEASIKANRESMHHEPVKFE